MKHMSKFSELVAQLHHGDTDRDLSRELATVLNECRKTGKKGSLTLEIVISPVGAESVMLDANVKTKAPSTPRESLKFYVDSELNLTRRMPGQLELSDLIAPGE